MGERTFKKVQFGKELKTAKGTEVNATSIFLGDAGVPSDRQYVAPNYNLALRARAAEFHLYEQKVDSFALTVENGYFQILPMLFSMLLKGDITATEHTEDQDDYDWAFTPSLTATNSQDSFTFEVGDDVEQYLLTYVMAKRLTIEGAMGQNAAIKLGADCFAKSIAATDFTSGLTIPTIEPMVANMTQLFIDTSWADRGVHDRPGLLRDFSLEMISGLHPRFHGNGLTMDSHGETYIDVMLRMTLEGNSTADGYYDGYLARTPYAIELKIPGSAIGTGQTHFLTVDLWGRFEEMVPMGSEADGDNLHTALFHGFYDPTGAAMLAVNVCTDKSTV